jgi:CHAT domain-containing protein/tetratricopeptide (TPR) repeat protein
VRQRTGLQTKRTGISRPTIRAAAALFLGALASVAAADPAADLAAARSAQSRGEPAAAESLATSAITALEHGAPADSMAIADAYLLRGNAHMKYAGYADGRALADGMHALGIRSRHSGASSASIAEAELLVGRVLQGSDHTDSALVHMQRVVDLRTASLAPDDTLLAEAWDQLALLRRDRREFRPAIDAWDKAIEVRSKHDGAESPAVALLRAQTGACWMELGDRARARAVLEGSLATFARLGATDHPSRWVPLNILADLERREGNIARDVDLLQESLRLVLIHFGENSRQALTMRWNLANALFAFSDFEGSREMCADLEPRMAAQYGPTHIRTMWVRQALAAATAQASGPADGLRAYASIESTLEASTGPTRAMLSANQKEQAHMLTALHRHQEADVMCLRARRSALSTQPLSSMDLSESYFQRILALAAIPDTAALAAERRGLDTLRTRFGKQPGYFPSTLTLFSAYADAHLGRRDLAWTEALEAERLAHENNRINVRRLSDRRAFQYSRRTLGELEQVLDLARGDTSRTAMAWDCLARERGLIGTELAQRSVPAGLESDTLVSSAHARWRAAQDVLARLMVRGAPTDSAARGELERARADADEAERLYARTLDERGAGSPPHEYGIADLSARLASGQALVSFVTVHAGRDTSRLEAFVARAGDPALHAVELGRASTIAAAAEAWRAALATLPAADRARAGTEERECLRLGEQVRSRVWDPIAKRVGETQEMFVVSDGALADLPWAALPAPNGKYWVESGPLVHPLDTERALMEPAAAASTGRLLAVGAPDFDRSVAPPIENPPIAAALVRSAPDPCSNAGAIVLKPLPGSGAEAESISVAWRRANAGPTTLLEGADATETEFKRAAPGCSVIHLATHGVMRGDRCSGSFEGARGLGGVTAVALAMPAAPTGHAKSVPAAAPATPAVEVSPWLSRRVWLALAGANQPPSHWSSEDEGFLTAEEVATLDLNGTDWVVLSACHSGAGDAWSSEGRLGMRRAFALAGARSVIASAWALGDATTGEWMEALYDARLHGGEDAAAAVRDASRRVLAARRAAHRSTHPFYWAAFSASGR